MLMRSNVAAGIGFNEQGEYCRAALQRSDRKEPRYKWPTSTGVTSRNNNLLGQLSAIVGLSCMYSVIKRVTFQNEKNCHGTDFVHMTINLTLQPSEILLD